MQRSASCGHTNASLAIQPFLSCFTVRTTQIPLQEQASLNIITQHRTSTVLNVWHHRYSKLNTWIKHQAVVQHLNCFFSLVTIVFFHLQWKEITRVYSTSFRLNVQSQASWKPSFA